MRNDLNRPLFFRENRVYRSYLGGKLFSDFFHDDSEDSNYPEEWVASVVEAFNPTKEKEGLSVVENSNVTLKELIEKYPEEMCGSSGKFSLLVKMLDSAIRLPLQAHPDPEFSKNYLNSDYGKAEMWIVLATREEACIYFGFKEKMTKEDLKRHIDKSRTDPHALDHLLNRVPVKTGDVYFVPARAVHAIGAGCLILEVQEPTDFTVEPEFWCGNLLREEDKLFMGLNPDLALDCFDYNLFGEKSVAVSRRVPCVVSEQDGVKIEMLISYEDTPCFQVRRCTLHGAKLQLEEAPAVYVVTNGRGKIISGSGFERMLCKGDYFYLPYAAKDTCTITAGEELEFVECLPHQ